MQLINSDDLISGDKFLNFSNTENRVTYSKTDFIYRGGIWRGQRVPSLLSHGKKLRGQALIFGHSDLRIPKSTCKLLSSLTGAKRIYGTNLGTVAGMSDVLPLGLTNNSGESHLHDILGDISHFRIANDHAGDFERKFDFSFYSNFTVQNNIGVRAKLARIVSKLPSSYSLRVEEPSMTKEGRVNYLASLRKNNFVLCPEGNGLDTHRLWETLYMGGVPVVTSSEYLNSLYNRLPVVVLDSWKQLLSPSKLEEKWHAAQDFEWDDSLLSQTYWLNKISQGL
jgi:hypothetical protein